MTNYTSTFFFFFFDKCNRFLIKLEKRPNYHILQLFDHSMD